jgi:hypothetical protein
MDVPARYTLGAPTPSDLAAVAAVVITDELDHTGQIVLGDGISGSARAGGSRLRAWRCAVLGCPRAAL